VDSGDVVELVATLSSLGVVCWLDGGWGVDCLLEEETRSHGDLDVVIARSDLAMVEELLKGRGFEVIRSLWPTAVAFGHADGREVDLHPVDVTDDGGGDQVLEDGSVWHYSPPAMGAVAGTPVPCAPARDQILMHEGYPPRPIDIADIKALCARFNIDLPEWVSGG
jgi:lincosamide nucleotidyltransferase A/C/D/E